MHYAEMEILVQALSTPTPTHTHAELFLFELFRKIIFKFKF